LERERLKRKGVDKSGAGLWKVKESGEGEEDDNDADEVSMNV